MLINLRNAMMAGKRLPYDAELEYLQSSGTQYIDTGVKGNASASLVIECTFLQKQYSGTVGFVFGSRSAANKRFGFVVIPGGSGGNYSFGYRSDHVYNVALSSNFETVRFVATPTLAECTFRGTTLIASDAPLDTNLNIYIFTRNFSGSTGQNFEGCLASLKIYANGVLVRDYIPVRKGTVGYLYDRVSGKLFGNAGTGDFVLGPDKN